MWPFKPKQPEPPKDWSKEPLYIYQVYVSGKEEPIEIEAHRYEHPITYWMGYEYADKVNMTGARFFRDEEKIAEVLDIQMITQ